MPGITFDTMQYALEWTPYLPANLVPLLPKLARYDRGEVEQFLVPQSIGAVPSMRVGTLKEAGCEGLDATWELFDEVFPLVNTGLTIIIRITSSKYATVLSVGGRNTLTGAVVSDHLLRQKPQNFFVPLPVQTTEGNITVYGFSTGNGTFRQFAMLGPGQESGNVAVSEGGNISIFADFHPPMDLSRFSPRPRPLYASRGMQESFGAESLMVSKGAITGIGAGSKRPSRRPATNKANVTDYAQDTFVRISSHGVVLDSYNAWAEKANLGKVTDAQIKAWAKAQADFVNQFTTYTTDDEENEADTFAVVPEVTAE